MEAQTEPGRYVEYPVIEEREDRHGRSLLVKNLALGHGGSRDYVTLTAYERDTPRYGEDQHVDLFLGHDQLVALATAALKMAERLREADDAS